MTAPVTTASTARAVVGDAGGGTSPNRAEQLYRFVSENGFRSCLELGFMHGVSSVYIAAALEANGAGHLTSVDIPYALELTPLASDLLERAGLSHRVELVVNPDSYVWWLRKQLRGQQRGKTIEPLYDFVFIDGAHTWDHDALAFLLVDRLLRPGGWVLLDDLDWCVPEGASVPADTLSIPHVREIWDLLIESDPSYDELRSDGSWGFAHKSAIPTPAVRTVVQRDLVGQVRELGRIARSKLRG